MLLLWLVVPLPTCYMQVACACWVLHFLPVASVFFPLLIRLSTLISKVLPRFWAQALSAASPWWSLRPAPQLHWSWTPGQGHLCPPGSTLSDAPSSSLDWAGPLGCSPLSWGSREPLLSCSPLVPPSAPPTECLSSLNQEEKAEWKPPCHVCPAQGFPPPLGAIKSVGFGV